MREGAVVQTRSMAAYYICIIEKAKNEKKYKYVISVTRKYESRYTATLCILVLGTSLSVIIKRSAPFNESQWPSPKLSLFLFFHSITLCIPLEMPVGASATFN